MTGVHKINSESDTGENLQAIKDDIAALKRDIAMLVGTLKDQATERAKDTFSDLSDEALHAYENFAAQSKRAGKAINRQVEEQPVAGLLIAFAVGFIASRLLSRD